MLAIFWLSALGLVYVYVGYALLLWLRPSALCPPTLCPLTEPVPKISIIVAVHNGEDLIHAKIADCLRLDWPSGSMEVLVASDGSTDATEERVRGVADLRVRLVAGPREGKEAAQKRAIAMSSGEILVFTDAGVSLEPGALRQLVAAFDDPEVGCVSGVDRVVDIDSDGVARQSGESAFVRFDTWLKLQESRCGSTVGNSGWLFAVRRKLCEDWPAALPSDFTILLRVVRAGYRGILMPGAVASGEGVPSSGDEFRRKVRTMVRGMTVLWRHADLLNPFRHGFFSVQLLSHKLLRWLLPIPMVGLFVASGWLSFESPFFAAVFLAQSLFWGVGLFTPRFRIPRYFAITTAAAVLAGSKFLCGERYLTWQPSVRHLPEIEEL